jgi:hypothetical protein
MQGSEERHGRSGRIMLQRVRIALVAMHSPGKQGCEQSSADALFVVLCTAKISIFATSKAPVHSHGLITQGILEHKYRHE